MNDCGNYEPPAGQDFDGNLAFDIAERERLEAERRDLKARVQHSQKLESLGVLAGAVAHDFNNFLTGILGNAGMVLRKLPEDSDCRPMVEEIERAAQHAAALSNQMLAYTGRTAAVRQAFDLKSLIEEMAPLLRISVSKKAALRLELADGLPAVEGDPSQIRQVIMNLITNASDALGSGSGYISLAAGILEADRAYLANAEGGAGLPEGPYVYLEVSDTGSGMDEAAQARLYDPAFTTKGPWSRTMPCTAASPRPRPSNVVVKKGSKARSRVASSMPSPSSRTSRHSASTPSRAPASRVMRTPT